MRCSARRACASIRRMGAAPATASPRVRRHALEEFFALELPPGHHHAELRTGAARLEAVIFPGLTVVADEIFAP